jgi:hypothetical protein
VGVAESQGGAEPVPGSFVVVVRPADVDAAVDLSLLTWRIVVQVEAVRPVSAQARAQARTHAGAATGAGCAAARGVAIGCAATGSGVDDLWGWCRLGMKGRRHGTVRCVGIVEHPEKTRHQSIVLASYLTYI